MAKLSAIVIKDKYFREIVATSKYECEAVRMIGMDSKKKKKK